MDGKTHTPSNSGSEDSEKLVFQESQTQSFRNAIQSMEGRLAHLKSSPNAPPKESDTPVAPAKPVSKPRQVTAQSGHQKEESVELPPALAALFPRGRFICPMCFEEDKQILKDGRKLMSTACRHTFCDSCMKEVLKTQQNCPACNTFLKSGDVKQIWP